MYMPTDQHCRKKKSEGVNFAKCNITPFSGKLHPEAKAWVFLNTRATSPTMGPSVTTVDNPFHYTAGQPCLQSNCLSRPSPPDHPHMMTRRSVTRMPRVTMLPTNVTCRRVTHITRKASSLARVLISLYVT